MSQQDKRFTTTLTALLLAAGSAGCMDFDGLDEPVELATHVGDWRDQIIYQVLIDRFADGETGNNHNVVDGSPGKWHGGDWAGLEGKLDYLADLGVTTLWISPVVRNLETDAGFDGYHGYWTQSFVDVNPHFGDLAALRSLVKAAHERGMLIILDIVTNHIGQLFYYDINRNGQPDEFFIGGGGTAYGSGNTDYPSDMTRTSEWDPDYDSRGIQAFSSLGESGPAPIVWVYDPEINRIPPEPAVFQNPDWYNRRGRVTVWAHENEACEWRIGTPPPSGWWWTEPQCRSYIRTQEMRGDFPGGLKDLDTTRCDVKQTMVDVFARWVELTDLDGFRIDTLKHVEHEFWRYFTQKVRQRLDSQGKKNFYMFGEAFDGNAELVGSFTTHTESPSAEEQSCVIDSRQLTGDQVDGVFHFPQYFTLRDVVLNGSPARNLTDLWNARSQHYGDAPNQLGIGVPPIKALVNFLDNHDVERFLFDKNATVPKLHLALTILFTQDGLPCVYYGTEQQLDGGDDPANREDMWLTGYDQSNPTYQWISRLARIRKAYPALRRGDMDVVWPTDPTDDGGIFAFERAGGDAGGGYALVVANANPDYDSTTEFSGTPMQVMASGNLVDVLTGQSYTVGAGGELAITLGPSSGAILIPQSEVVPGL